MTKPMNLSLEERDLHYAQRLAEMIRCRTVSKKDSFEPEEFLKLRTVIQTLFPLLSEKAELTILGDDAYLYKWRGTDQSRNVMVMSHHDVVEATGSWQEEPFAGVIRDGKLWGRGTVDTKTPLFAEFSAIEELLAEGFVFPVNVYLFSSHNEETGGDGALLALDYFKEQGLRFDWIIDEGGAVIDPPMSGIHKKCAMMAVHEKGRCTADLLSKKPQGHAGLEGNHQTPVMRMAAFMTEVDQKKPFIRRLHPEVRGMFEALAPPHGLPHGGGLFQPVAVLRAAGEDDAQAERCSGRDAGHRLHLPEGVHRLRRQLPRGGVPALHQRQRLCQGSGRPAADRRKARCGGDSAGLGQRVLPPFLSGQHRLPVHPQDRGSRLSLCSGGSLYPPGRHRRPAVCRPFRRGHPLCPH